MNGTGSAENRPDAARGGEPTEAPAATAHARIPGTAAFLTLLAYYWALQFFMENGAQVSRGDVMYYLYVIPVAAFAAVMLCARVVTVGLNPPARLMALYAVIVGVAALVRSDLSTVISSGLFAATVVVVFACRFSPPAGFLNTLFLASIPLNTLLYLAGRTLYAPVPGFSRDGELWWRVAIFPDVSTSAYYCLIVLLVNLLRPAAPFRRTCIVLAGYFLIYSGLRSAIIAGVLAGGYYMFTRMGRLRRPSARLWYLGGAVSLFVISLLSSQLLLLLPSFGNETLNMYLFRSGGGLASEADAAKTIYRTYIWSEHLRLASLNPVFGIGTFDFTAVSIFDPLFGDYGRGSEAYLTGLYARVGLPSLLLLASFIAAIVQGVRANQHLHLVIGLCLFVAMLAYGSFINAYDFVFLAMLGLLARTDDDAPAVGAIPGRPS